MDSNFKIGCIQEKYFKKLKIYLLSFKLINFNLIHKEVLC